MADQQIANALGHVVQELRIQSLAKHVRDYHGEGTQKFMSWLQDVDQLATPSDSEPETMSSDEEEIPLAQLRERWVKEKEQEEIEENLPLSELSKRLSSKPSGPEETPSVPVKRPLPRDESPPPGIEGIEEKGPPEKFYRRTLSDVESDESVSESEIFDVDEKGACKQVNVTNPSKAVLFARLMDQQAKLMSMFEKL